MAAGSSPRRPHSQTPPSPGRAGSEARRNCRRLGVGSWQFPKGVRFREGQAQHGGYTIYVQLHGQSVISVEMQPFRREFAEEFRQSFECRMQRCKRPNPFLESFSCWVEAWNRRLLRQNFAACLVSRRRFSGLRAPKNQHHGNNGAQSKQCNRQRLKRERTHFHETSLS